MLKWMTLSHINDNPFSLVIAMRGENDSLIVMTTELDFLASLILLRMK